MSLRPFQTLAVVLLVVAPLRAQVPNEAEPVPDPVTGPGPGAQTDRVPTALRSTLDALGASVGVPDGFGYSWTPRKPVAGQPATMGLTNYQFGLTAPVYTTDDELYFADGSVRALDVRSNAVLPTDRTRFPRTFWDIQAGGGYVRQLGDGWSWGATLNLGTASDKPFHSLSEGTLSALAFVRKPSGEQDAWLFYVVSTSNGQLGRNIPVPGVAYEYHAALVTAVIGFPFVSIDYRPTREWQFEFNYGALTDVLARGSYHLTDHFRVFAAFEWTNQAWFRADRRNTRSQFFLYEKRLEAGVAWHVHKHVNFSVTPGYAFDRFFVESQGFGFRGPNRTNIGSALFVAAQFELKY